MDRPAVERAVSDLLRALGHAPEGELADTPRLVAEAWCDELVAGQGLDPLGILAAGAVPVDDAMARPGARQQLVVMRGLAAATICPHHLLPATGEATIAYLPGQRMAGFGAIARALEACTRRLTLQEQAGAAMADALCAGLGARGAACRLVLVHGCFTLRGPRETGARIESLALAGSFAEPGPDRDLALATLAR